MLLAKNKMICELFFLLIVTLAIDFDLTENVIEVLFLILFDIVRLATLNVEIDDSSKF